MHHHGLNSVRDIPENRDAGQRNSLMNSNSFSIIEHRLQSSPQLKKHHLIQNVQHNLFHNIILPLKTRHPDRSGRHLLNLRLLSSQCEYDSLCSASVSIEWISTGSSWHNKKRVSNSYMWNTADRGMHPERPQRRRGSHEKRNDRQRPPAGGISYRHS